MGNKQQRFKTEKSIIEAIDKGKARAEAQLRESADLETKGDWHRDEAARMAGSQKWEERGAHIVEMGVCRERAKNLRKRATRTLNVSLKKLQDALAAFRTATLFPGDDKAVVIE